MPGVLLEKSDAKRTAAVVKQVEDATDGGIASTRARGQAVRHFYGQIYDSGEPDNKPLVRDVTSGVWSGRLLQRSTTAPFSTVDKSQDIWIVHADLMDGQPIYHNRQHALLLPFKKDHDESAVVRDLYLAFLPVIEFPGTAAATIAAAGSGQFEIWDDPGNEVEVLAYNVHMANAVDVDSGTEGTVRWNPVDLRWDVVHAACPTA
jgi:hypothetical protein